MSAEWQAPQPQDYPHRETNGVDRLVSSVRVVAEKSREVTSNLMRTAGIFITQQGMRIASSLTVEGDLTSTGSADITGTTHIGGSTDIDGTLNVDADATFGGNATFDGAVAITGTLSLPAGIIDNDALANPIVQRSNYAGSSAFALTTSPVAFSSHTITVPDGCTDGAFSATGSAGVYNSTGGPQYVYLRVYASADGYLAWGARQQVAVLAGYYATLSATLIREYDVPLTPGANVTFYVEVYASAAIGADASNYAFCEELVTFTR